MSGVGGKPSVPGHFILEACNLTRRLNYPDADRRLSGNSPGTRSNFHALRCRCNRRIHSGQVFVVSRPDLNSLSVPQPWMSSHVEVLPSPLKRDGTAMRHDRARREAGSALILMKELRINLPEFETLATTAWRVE